MLRKINEAEMGRNKRNGRPKKTSVELISKIGKKSLKKIRNMKELTASREEWKT